MVLESTLFDRDGVVTAHTVKSAYFEQDGIRYPTEIESTFPGESAWMRFVMRRVDVNIELDPALFAIEPKLATVRKRGFAQVDIFAGEGPSLEETAE